MKSFSNQTANPLTGNWRMFKQVGKEESGGCDNSGKRFTEVNLKIRQFENLKIGVSGSEMIVLLFEIRNLKSEFRNLESEIFEC